MYAVIEVGGKQYKVREGDILDVENQRKKEQQSINLSKVLLIAQEGNINIGQPYIKGAKVTATVLKNLKASKVISYKYRRRKASRWKKGHRQALTRVEIKGIKPA